MKRGVTEDGWRKHNLKGATVRAGAGRKSKRARHKNGSSLSATPAPPATAPRADPGRVLEAVVGPERNARYKRAVKSIRKKMWKRRWRGSWCVDAAFIGRVSVGQDALLVLGAHWNNRLHARRRGFMYPLLVPVFCDRGHVLAGLAAHQDCKACDEAIPF